MTEQEALKAVKDIKAISNIDEKAHRMEDTLYIKFISDVAKRTDNLGKVARIILTTLEIDFERWYS